MAEYKDEVLDAEPKKQPPNIWGMANTAIPQAANLTPLEIGGIGLGTVAAGSLIRHYAKGADLDRQIKEANLELLKRQLETPALQPPATQQAAQTVIQQTAPTAPTTPVNPQTLLPQQPVDLNAKIEAAKQANAARATSVAPPELVGPAPELVGPSIPPEAPAAPIAPKNMVGPPPELTGPVKPDIASRVRRNAEQIASEKAAQLAATPEGMRPVPPNPKQNVGPGEKIGVGGYTHPYNTYGERTPLLWEQAIGPKNMGYPEAGQRIQNFAAGEMMGGEPGRFTETPLPPGNAGRPKFAPGFIKGAASPQALAATAALATIPSLATAGYEAYKGNKEAVDTNLSDAWSSLKSVATMPYDVVKSAGKGDFGPLKDLLMSANPATLLLNATSKHDEEILKKMIAKERYAAQVGGGRGSQGVPPP